MKTHRLYISLLAFCCCLNAAAQKEKRVQEDTPYQLDIKEANILNKNDTVAVRILFTAKQNTPGQRSAILVPELIDTLTNMSAELPCIYINSRNQQIVLERNNKGKQTDYIAVRKKRNKDVTIDYLKSVAYEPWMENSVLRLKSRKCNCNISRSENQEYICAFNENEDTINLFPTYRVPKAENVKVRSESGSAYLCYELDKTEIKPAYKTNLRELAKIRNSINLVKNDQLVEIQGMSITGYASPEGDCQHNAMLSRQRTESLKKIIERSGSFNGINIQAEGKGEDWDGFVAYLNKHEDIPQRDILMSILDKNLEDLDAIEDKMKQEAPEGFNYCLANCFPELRRTDYSINYIVGPFILEESEEIFKTRPMNLSLNEIYLLADKYKDDEIKYKEIMQKTYTLYPEDEAANLTMAYLALKNRDTAEAERYLKKVGQCPEKTLNEGIIAYLKNDVKTAKTLVTEAAAEGLEEAVKQLEEFKKIDNNLEK